MNVAIVLLVLTAGVFGKEIDGNPVSLENDLVYAKAAKPTFMADIRTSVLNIKRHKCNAVLLDAKWVLVPVYCIKKKPFLGKFEISIGSKNVPIKKIIKHEKANSINNDIALILLGKEVHDIPFVNLPPSNATYSGSATLYTRDNKNNVQSLDVKIQPQSVCKGSPPLLDIHICAGDKKNSTVKGQEGSALTVNDPNGGNIIVGMLSWVRKGKDPAVYTRISSYTEWIMRKMVTALRN